MTQGKRIKLTPKARDDLKDIFSYGVSHYGEVAADAYIDRIFTALDMLKHHEIGQRRAEVGENMFSLVAAEHLLFSDQNTKIFWLSECCIIHGM
ncbi:type II toxin-antitoxin system RelE/ParE family toxin [Erwinia rhapontici]|uniref:type II toxin-antitoxin system RelE/ParE family toxin n=1 Tax=Erwinia rhapontici TaxID=55212 RepID=UPI0021689856|nr:type II toxin-antitoxin system RelE/ParE family toxin [Erwinia rhapontici]MCS3608654.1 toxin ParE1/3/4 [Erwinia rhapontici]